MRRKLSDERQSVLPLADATDIGAAVAAVLPKVRARIALPTGDLGSRGNLETASRFRSRTSTTVTVSPSAPEPHELTDLAAPGELFFQHALFCQISLPRSQTEADTYVRKSGRASLMVSAGSLFIDGEWQKQCIPYGAVPRMALAHICTYAVRHRTRTIPTGRDPRAFMANIGMSVTAGRNYASLRKQIHALAACRIQIGFDNRTINSQPVDQFDAWAGKHGLSIGESRWPQELVMSDAYYQALIDHAVPLNQAALLNLHRSALALDVYAFLAYRLHRLDANLFLKWKTLRDQFGEGYEDLSNFRTHFTRTLDQVRTQYPTARVERTEGGILMRPSPPATALTIHRQKPPPIRLQRK